MCSALLPPEAGSMLTDKHATRLRLVGKSVYGCVLGRKLIRNNRSAIHPGADVRTGREGERERARAGVRAREREREAGIESERERESARAREGGGSKHAWPVDIA
jgi:hypothetical protein